MTLRWRDTPIDKLDDTALSQALKKTLQILHELLKEQQKRYNEVRRKATEEMLLDRVREDSGVLKPNQAAILSFARPVSGGRRPAPERGKRTEGEDPGGGKGGPEGSGAT